MSEKRGKLAKYELVYLSGMLGSTLSILDILYYNIKLKYVFLHEIYISWELSIL